MATTPASHSGHTFDPDSVVIGAELALDTDAQGNITIYSLGGGRPQPLGTFSDVADAWRLIDALDTEDLPLAA